MATDHLLQASLLSDLFGHASCEAEVRHLGEKRYSEIFFEEVPFRHKALERRTYLIIGRRGSGKTALARFFSFQREFPDALSIRLDQRRLYHEFFSELPHPGSAPREVLVPAIANLWACVLWANIGRRLVEQRLLPFSDHASSTPHRMTSVVELLQWLKRQLEVNDFLSYQQCVDRLDDTLSLGAVRKAALSIVQRRTIFFVVDTLETYQAENPLVMLSLAGLVQVASDFNERYADRGLHIKVFLPGELFPRLREEFVLNPLKSIRWPVYLLWRPKDLLRLICWRLVQNLGDHASRLFAGMRTLDWDQYKAVLDTVWTPFFGGRMQTRLALADESFPYLLRHTQLRPRQLILLCNSVAEAALTGNAGVSLPLPADAVRNGVHMEEGNLASEILNAYHEVYPSAARIILALKNSPTMFPGNELDRRAPRTKVDWPAGTYSPARFREMVAELGVVGRVRRYDSDDGYVDAEFGYAAEERLDLVHDDQCVIHPMFFRRLTPILEPRLRVMSFGFGGG